MNHTTADAAMTKPRSGPVLSVMIPLLTGCLRVQPQPLPAPEARQATAIRGVVLTGAGAGERIEYRRVDHVEWTDSTVLISGVLAGTAGNADAGSEAVTARSFPISTLDGVLVRRLDPNRTSILIGTLAVGSIVVATFLLTGQADENTVLQLTR